MNDKLKVKCPTCETEFFYYQSEFRPFCKERCKMIDLGGWFQEKFTVKSNTPLNEEDINEIEKALIERQKNKWQNRCKAARKRIENHFDIQKMLVMYKEVWIEAENKF